MSSIVTSDLSEPSLTPESIGELDVDFDVQIPQDHLGEHFPNASTFEFWAKSAFACEASSNAELTIRIVDEQTMCELNLAYRDKDKPTNVLSFPSEIPEIVRQDLQLNPLGDIVICHSVIVKEAAEQEKCLSSHYAHMTVHGVLHLCGYDHETEHEASQMESLETKILHQLGVPNPYI